MTRPTRVGPPSRDDITIRMGIDQWRDNVDALTAYPHEWNRTRISVIRDGMAEIVNEVTHNPMRLGNEHPDV